MYTLDWCPEVQHEHGQNRRQYAHVFHIPDQVCLAREFEDLPEKFRLGILMHELGHIWAGPEASERAADETFAQRTGITIGHRSSQFGGSLEYLEPRDFQRAREILMEVFS